MKRGLENGADWGALDRPSLMHGPLDKPKSELRLILENIQGLKQESIKYRASNYDISERCNLTCEGCLFFSGRSEQTSSLDRDADKWHEFFRSERDRGINYAYLAGAEPALEPKILRIAAQYIPYGVIYTNGSIKIDPDLPYRIHISTWGYGRHATAFRGADVNAKALKNFEGQRRAVVIMTINSQNIGDIETIAQKCSDHGLELSFSFFSSTSNYLALIEDKKHERDDYSRFSNREINLKMAPDDFQRARERIDRAAARFPNTVVISRSFYKWASQERMPFVYDADGVAQNCGFRLTETFKHFDVARSEDKGKCCSPNIDCSDCRAYAMASASFLKAKHDHRSIGQMKDYLETWDFWSRLFLPLSHVATH